MLVPREVGVTLSEELAHPPPTSMVLPDTRELDLPKHYCNRNTLKTYFRYLSACLSHSPIFERVEKCNVFFSLILCLTGGHKEDGAPLCPPRDRVSGRQEEVRLRAPAPCGALERLSASEERTILQILSFRRTVQH